MITMTSRVFRLTPPILVMLIAGCGSKAPPGTVWVTGTLPPRVRHSQKA